MTMSGRKSVVSLQEQKIVLQKYHHHFEDADHLPTPKDNVYAMISKDLMRKMTPKALYASIRRNYTFFFLTKHVPIDTDKNRQSYNESECSSCSSDTEDSDCDTSLKQYDFLIDCHKWKEIEPQFFYTQRNQPDKPNLIFTKKLKLPKRKWTYILSLEIWKQTKLPCTWCMKSHFCYKDGEVLCIGYCNQCLADLKVYITPKSNTDAFLDVHCTIKFKNNNIEHNSKAKLRMTTYQRREIAERLQNKSPIVVRNELAEELLPVQHSDSRISHVTSILPAAEPPHLPKLEQLHHIKNESKKENVLHNNPLLSLSKMTTMPPFSTFIHQISARPFYLYYWSPQQIEYYKNCLKSQTHICVSIDATGSICKNIARSDKSDDIYLGPSNSKHILLYVVVAYAQNGATSVPLSQMLSESQTADTISQWLSLWKDSMASPNEAIIDDSAALISATIKAFTGFNSTKSYIDNCFKILEKESSVTVPPCFVRLDTSHFLRTLWRLACFDNIDYHVKSFYVGCLKLIKQCQDYETIKLIALDMVVVSLYKNDICTQNVTETICNVSKSRLYDLLNRYKNFPEEPIVIPNITNLTIGGIHHRHIFTETNNTSSATGYAPIAWLTKFIDRQNLLLTLIDVDGDRINSLYLPEMCNVIVRILSRLPLFSNVMCPIFHNTNYSPSSSNVESHFKTLKTLVLKNERYLRVDNFLVKHHDYLQGEMKMAINNQKVDFLYSDRVKLRPKRSIARSKRNIKKNTDDFLEESVFSDKLLKSTEITENWRGLTKKRKLESKDGNSTKRTKISVLQNGGLSQNIQIVNTCAFDSVAQCFAVAYAESVFVRNSVENNTDNFSKLIQSMVKSVNMYDMYANRSLVLETCFPINDNLMDCHCNVTFIYEKILIDTFPSAKFQSTCSFVSCSNKNIERKIAILPLDLNIIKMKGIAFLNESALNGITEKGTACRRNDCEGTRNNSYELLDIITFEIIGIRKISLTEAPITLLLNNKTYRLLSVIEYCPTAAAVPGGMGHYKSHCLRKGSWHCYDDIVGKATNSKGKILPHVVMYMIQ